MSEESITHKDLTSRQLLNLKEIYVARRVSSMDLDQLKKFVSTVIKDQIMDTVGNQEEKEAWKEIKDYFANDFESIIKEVVKDKTAQEEDLNPEKLELEKRIELIEQRKKEKEKVNEDMW